MYYGIATKLRGFQSESLRVKVTREEGKYTWVTTADLLDAGTHLVLDTSQVTPEEPETVLIHKEGLVAF
jgi:hypothetical protein